MGGGALVFQAGYHRRKRTFKHILKSIYFSKIKIDPRYTLLHVLFFLNFSSNLFNFSLINSEHAHIYISMFAIDRNTSIELVGQLVV